MEETTVYTCFCTKNQDAPKYNFGWTKSEFCNVISVIRNNTDRDNTSRNVLWTKIFSTQFNITKNYLLRRFDIKSFAGKEAAHEVVLYSIGQIQRLLKQQHVERSGWKFCYGNLNGLFYYISHRKMSDELRRRNTTTSRSPRPYGNDEMARPTRINGLSDTTDDIESQMNQLQYPELERMIKEDNFQEDFLKALDNGMEKLKQYKNKHFYPVVQMFIFEKKEHQEIGRELGITEDYSGQIFLRAKAKLKDFIYSEMENKYPSLDITSIQI